MKKTLILLSVFCLGLAVFAFDYVPKNTNSNPFGSKSSGKQTEQAKQTAQPEMREIKTLAEYFRYLPAEVHRHWSPYKAWVSYEVTVQFIVHRDGTVSDLHIVESNCPNANRSVLDAVKSGAPYQPLPLSYSKDRVKAQVVLEYRKE